MLSVDCNHKGYRLWISNWISWCTNCGKDEQHVGEVILGRKHKVGDVVDSVDVSAVGNSGTGVSSVERVRSVTVYLAHPYARRDVGTRVEGLLQAAGISVINPFDRPEQAQIDAEWPNLGTTTCEDIVRGDLANINRADTVVAVVTGDRSIGTFMEIYHNSVVNSRVTFSLVLNDQDKTHPWLRTLTRMHYNTESLIEDILRWPNG